MNIHLCLATIIGYILHISWMCKLACIWQFIKKRKQNKLFQIFLGGGKVLPLMYGSPTAYNHCQFCLGDGRTRITSYRLRNLQRVIPQTAIICYTTGGGYTRSDKGCIGSRRSSGRSGSASRRCRKFCGKVCNAASMIILVILGLVIMVLLCGCGYCFGNFQAFAL